ncbi:MAG TPA: HXXEE domain-containing protein [Chondromyces sp.]|nr:HXXEE domain-containing protein [Chondromyces sp.]
MLNWLNNYISIETLIWLFPITFLIHDFEEIIFVESWFKKYRKEILPRIPKNMKAAFQDLASTTSTRFAIPVFLQFILYIFAALIAVEQHIYEPLLGMNIILFLHVFMHIGQSLYFRVYALGAGSALLVTLPYSVYLFYRLLHEGLAHTHDFFLSIPYGFLTIAAVLWGHRLARKILPA